MRRWLSGIIATGWLVACGSVAETEPPPASFDTDASTGPSLVAPGVDGGDGGGARQGFCQGGGPAAQLPSGTCIGDVAKNLFAFAVCSCTDWNRSGTLFTDSFNSVKNTSGGKGGSVGVNGDFGSSGDLAIGGSLWVSGALGGDAIAFTGQANVWGELHSGEGWRANAATIGQDAYVNGGILGQPSVNGRLFIPNGQSTGAATVTGGVVRQPVSVAPPCDCSTPLPIADIVKAMATGNDNAAVSLSPDRLKNTGGDTVLELPCGRYFLSSISTTGSLLIRLSGRTVIFVDGDVRLNGGATFELAPGAELDLLATGNLELTGSSTFGSPAMPSRVRLYMGGTRVQLTGANAAGANIYAPHARMDTSGDFTLSGAIFAKEFGSTGTLRVHYDESILDVVGCKDPTKPCVSCKDCTGDTPACRGNRCVPCETNADCCAPLQCVGGKCIATGPR